MKIQNTLFENKQYVETITKIHKSDQLSVMDAYRINRLVKKLYELNTEYLQLKHRIIEQYGTPKEDNTTFEIEEEQREPFMKEFQELLKIEHDLEMEMLSFPNKLEDGVSAADLNIMEMFFDLSTITELKDEPESSIENEKE